MPQTNLQRRESYYKRIIEDAKNSKDAPRYQEVCSSIEDLIVISRKLRGSDRIMKPVEFRELKAKYDTAKAKCDTYLSGADDFTDFENSRKPIIEEISKVLIKDLKALETYDPNTLRTLSQVIKKARTHVVVLDKEDFNKAVGGNLSSRIPLKTRGAKKGFFTPNKIFDPDVIWKKQIEAFEGKFKEALGDKFSENFKNKLELLKTDEKLQLEIAGMFERPEIDPRFRGTEEADKALFINMGLKLGLGENEDEVALVLKNSDGMRDAIFDFTASIISNAYQQKFMAKAGIKKMSSLTNRNCAMSDMSRLLGCGSLLASAEPMTIQVGNETIEGVFMETADGSDLNRLKADDPMYYANQNSLNNRPEFFRQVADLQVLDFICGNIDRHRGNMIYQLSSGEGTVPLFTGLKGIDNDCSFGTPKIEKDKQIVKLVNPEIMQYMTAEMATKVKELNKEMFELTLQHNGLREDEINAAWERVELVRDAIEKDKVTIYKKDDWNRFNMMTSRTKDGNYFYQMKEMWLSLDNSKQEARRAKMYENKEKSIEYVKDRTDIVQILIDKRDTIDKLKEEMEASKAIIFNSSEYETMKKNFDNIDTLTKKMENQRNNNETVQEEDIEALTNAYLTLGEKTEQYIKLKKLLPKQTRGKLRRAFAVHLLEFANETMDDVEAEFDKVNKEPEKVTEEEMGMDK